MTRVVIIADSRARARRLSDLLAGDQRIEVIEAGTLGAGSDQLLFADAVLVAGLGLDQIPALALPVVVLADQADVVPWGDNLRAWLPLNASGAEIAAALIAVANDLTVLTGPQVRRWLPGIEPNRDSRETFVESLTPREVQVLRMLADGLGNKELADRLGISEHTIKFHVAQILAKLGAASRTEAVTIGIKRGLVPL